MDPTRSVLVVAFHFPPVAAAGTHRTLNFIRVLSRRGYRFGVVTVSSLEGLATDPRLLERVPPEVEVARARHVDPFRLLARVRRTRRDRPVAAAMPAGDAPPGGRPHGLGARLLDFTSRLANLPDRYSTWIPAALWRGVLTARRIGAGVLYTTAPPYTAHVVGLLLSRVLGIPWVVDLRDPWTINPFHLNPYRSLAAIDAALEGAVMRQASRVILNTRQAEAGYRRRYPGLDKFRTITNGIDPDLLALPRAPDRSADPNGRLRLLHLGAIYGRRYPSGLLDALCALRGARPELFARIVVEQIGAVDERDRFVAEIARRGLAGRLLVRDAVPHREAFRACQEAAGLLLLGPSGNQPELQVPSKVFEYLAAGRPILALAKRDGAIATVLAAAGGVHVIVDPDDAAAIRHGLIEMDRLVRGTAAGAAALERFSYETLASSLEEELAAAQERGG